MLRCCRRDQQRAGQTVDHHIPGRLLIGAEGLTEQVSDFVKPEMAGRVVMSLGRLDLIDRPKQRLPAVEFSLWSDNEHRSTVGQVDEFAGRRSGADSYEARADALDEPDRVCRSDVSKANDS